MTNEISVLSKEFNQKMDAAAWRMAASALLDAIDIENECHDIDLKDEVECARNHRDYIGKPCDICGEICDVNGDVDGEILAGELILGYYCGKCRHEVEYNYAG